VKELPHKCLKWLKRGGAEDKNMAKNSTKVTVETLTHVRATLKNILAAEYQSVMAIEGQAPYRVTYKRRPDGSE
jgi:hypothetical protein